MSARRRRLDPVTLSVLANRVDAIVREMSNALLKSARSTVIASARDLSCSIVTGDNRLLSATDGIPVHLFGSDLQTQSMVDLHADLAEGDAYLHNDPYLGNTHAGDHTILVPVYFRGRHVFTACAKAHQADIGNAIPATFHAAARDVYEEGALVFPCTRVQRGYAMIEDVIRLCRARIRVPDQWYGDFLATLGSARTGERRLQELCAKYGLATIDAFVEEWLDYSERRMIQAIRKLPAASIAAEIAHDPVPPLVPDRIPVRVKVNINPRRGRVEVDLRDNIDNLPCGLNQSEACVRSNTLIGVLNALGLDIPRNSGSFRRVRILVREGSVLGKPRFPASCSLATTNVADRLINAIQAAFAAIGEGHGLAHGGTGMSAVVSGRDYRHGGAPFINQPSLNVNGGPGGPQADGWVTYGMPNVGGMMLRESLELVEIKHPILFEYHRLRPGSAGAGRRRGAPGGELSYGPRGDPITIATASDSQIFPAQGVRGGAPGAPSANFRIGAGGREEKLPGVAVFELKPGERVRFENAAGGGYGNPLDREPERVLADVRRGWETLERARAVYGVVLTGTVADETLAIDHAQTAARRAAGADSASPGGKATGGD